MAKPARPSKRPKALSFEQALAKLEQIVQAIESGQTPLEQSIEQYEQGMALIAQCREILARAEQRQEIFRLRVQAVKLL